jgi:hypothetical protein
VLLIVTAMTASNQILFATYPYSEESKAIPVTDRGGPYVIPVRFERHLHIK